MGEPGLDPTLALWTGLRRGSGAAHAGHRQTPAGTSTARVKLFGMMSSGWVTFDDISLRACASGGQGAPGGGGISGSSAPGAEQPVEPSPEDLLLLAEPDWEVVPGAPCLDGDECPPVEADEVPTPVRWALPEAWEAAIVSELLGQAAAEPSAPQAGIDSGGTTVIKRYAFGGRVVAMRRGDTLYFLSGDHLGSASVTLDEQGRWLADHRFWPYGETKRLDGASESYPTDRLFTGMLYRDTIGLYRMGARWISPALGRWISADTLVPNPANPQSLNRFSYALGNPLRYRDPTGYWEEEWEEQFEQEHGRAPTEQDWWDYQFSLEISDFTGWVLTFALRQLLYAAGAELEHDGVLWNMEEVEAVSGGIGALADAMGGVPVYLEAVGPITFLRENKLQREGWVPALYARVYDASTGDLLRFYISVFNRAGYPLTPRYIVHELAHHWDSRFKHSQSFATVHQTGGPSAHANTKLAEDWAESVSYYVTGATPPPPYALSPRRRMLVSLALACPTPSYCYTH